MMGANNAPAPGATRAERPGPSKTFIAAVAFTVVLAVCAGWLVGDSLARRGSDRGAQPAPAASVSASVPVGGSSSEGGADESLCGLDPGDQTLPSGPLEYQQLRVAINVPDVEGVGPGIKENITHCFAHSPRGALVAAVNFMRWFSSREQILEVITTLMADDENRTRLADRVDAEWDRTTTTPQVIRGYRIEMRGPDEAAVTLATSMSVSDDVYVSWPLVLVWQDGDWRVKAPEVDSFGQQREESLAGFSMWTVV